MGKKKLDKKVKRLVAVDLFEVWRKRPDDHPLKDRAESICKALRYVKKF